MQNAEIVRVMTDAKNKNNVTHQAIADATGYSVSSISRFFAGKMDDIPVQFLKDMAKALDVPITDIFDESALATGAAVAEQPVPAGLQDPLVTLLRELLEAREQDYKNTIAALKEDHKRSIEVIKEEHATDRDSYERALIRREIFCYLALALVLVIGVLCILHFTTVL